MMILWTRNNDSEDKKLLYSLGSSIYLLFNSIIQFSTDTYTYMYVDSFLYLSNKAYIHIHTHLLADIQ